MFYVSKKSIQVVDKLVAKGWCASKTKILLRRALLHKPYYLEISKILTMTLGDIGPVPISCSTYDMVWLNAGI